MIPGDEQKDATRSDEGESQTTDKSMASRLSVWIGVIASLVTVILTLVNGYTKIQIDQKKTELDSRAQLVEESKERVSRYIFVHDLYPDILGKEIGKKTLSINLVRLALSPEEANTLFSGFQTSSSEELQSAGQIGISAMRDQELAKLVSEMDDYKATTRISAVQTLVQEYKASPTAVSLVLRLFDQTVIDTLSADGRVNAFVFLKETDPAAWGPEQIRTADDVVARIHQRDITSQARIGKRTQEVLDEFRTHLQKIKNGQ